MNRLNPDEVTMLSPGAVLRVDVVTSEDDWRYPHVVTLVPVRSDKSRALQTGRYEIPTGQIIRVDVPEHCYLHVQKVTDKSVGIELSLPHY